LNLTYRQPLIHGYAIGLKEEEPYGWIEFNDDRDALGRVESVFFLPLGDTEYWSAPIVQHCGQLLVKDPTLENVFNRFGIGSVWNSVWMGMKHEKTAIM
jgi:hypothetical protein